MLSDDFHFSLDGSWLEVYGMDGSGCMAVRVVVVVSGVFRIIKLLGG